MFVDHYSILGVNRTAEALVIQAAYRALAKKYHPDIWKGSKKEAQEKMVALNAAFEILSDAKKRKAYDKDYDENLKQADYSAYSDGDTNNASEDSEELDEQGDWDVVIEYYPHIEELRKSLGKISSKLATLFQIIIIVEKASKEAEIIAFELKNDFMRRYFGNNEELQELALSYIRAGNREAAKEINKAVSTLGQDSSEDILQKIRRKFNPDNFQETNEEDYLTTPFHRYKQTIATIQWEAVELDKVEAKSEIAKITDNETGEEFIISLPYDAQIIEIYITSGDRIKEYGEKLALVKKLVRVN